MAAVELQAISKQYHKQGQASAVLQHIDLQIKDGEFVVLVGPSGCGKSTLMRMIAGLEDISAGDLYIAGQRANAIPAQQRNVAMVFQSYALYPHLSVYENIAFGPKLRKESRQDYHPKILAAAEMLNLTPYLEHLPKALSGGQRQRVAMGRAVVRKPDVFLFDEPLSNLDAKLRVQMRAEIKALHQRLKNTVVYVTHDQVEAMTMGERIVVLHQGKIAQVGKPLDLYDKPANLFVAGFLGSPAMNFFNVQISADGQTLKLAQQSQRLPQSLNWLANYAGQTLTLGIRPEHLGFVNTTENADGEFLSLTLNVQMAEHTGAESYYYGEIAGSACCIASRNRHPINQEQPCRVQFAAHHSHWFSPNTELRLEP